MNIQTLTQQMQAEGLVMRASFRRGNYRCTVADGLGNALSESTHSRLFVAVVHALNKGVAMQDSAKAEAMSKAERIGANYRAELNGAAAPLLN